MRINWDNDKITVDKLDEGLKAKRIAVPAYQRGIVWSDKLKKGLIDSIKRGYPFGALMMYDFEESGKPLLLIDGLQRSTTLFDFVNSPCKYFENIDISDEIIKGLLLKLGYEEVTNEDVDTIKTKIVGWIQSFKGKEAINDMDPYDCASFLVKKFNKTNKDVLNDYAFLKEVKVIIDPIFSNFREIYNSVKDREIPVIKITGDDSELSTVFYRINDKFLPLSKEDKFAATWTNRSIKVTEEYLEEYVRINANRYTEIQRKGATIYGFDHQKYINKNEVDIYELCFAFGKDIKNNYQDLFGKVNDLNKPEHIGFIILNACLLGTKDDLKNMNKLMLSKFATDEEINIFIMKVLDAIKYVDGLLAPYIKFKSNKRFGGKKLHTDFQISSIIASVFKLRHINTDANGNHTFDFSSYLPSWSKNDTEFQKNLIKRYIYDALNNIWTSHGDEQLDEVINGSNDDYYTKEISAVDFKKSLFNWHAMKKINNKVWKEDEIKQPTDVDKLLLNVIYSESFTAKMQLDENKFDIEHLFPKNLAVSRLSRYHGSLKLPIAAFGNLCLLPESPNRQKKQKTIYEDTDYTNKLGEKITLKQLEDNYTFTKRSDLEWAENENINMIDLDKSYEKFIDDRFKIVAKKILKNLYPEYKEED